MGPMMVERLVHDQTGRWPDPRLRRMLKFSKSYPDRVTHTEPVHAAAGHHAG